MPKSIRHFDLSITLIAPVLTQSVEARNIGVDTAMQLYQGKPAISGSLLVGNIRHRLQEFIELAGNQAPASLSQTALDKWFGKASDKDRFDSSRRLINFSNYFLLTKVDDEEFSGTTASQKQTRIQIDATSGTVKQGSLHVMETLFPSGTKLTFAGSFSIVLGESEPSDTVDTINVWLGKALESITAMGANKGIGFGRLHSHSLGDATHSSSTTLFTNDSAAELPSDQSRFTFTLSPSEPFCIAKPHGADSNRFNAEEIISGGVIRGCLARFFSKDDLQKVNFAQWIVTHAKPISCQALEQRPSRPLPLPLSLAKITTVEKNQKPYLVCHDLLHYPAGLVTLSGSNDTYLPEFAPDWKYSTSNVISKYWGSDVQLERLLRVQTGLKGRFEHDGALQADDEKLFSMELINPTNHTWLFEIDLSELTSEQQDQARQFIRAFLDKTLVGLGKTDSCFEINAVQQPETLPTVVPIVQDGYRVQLATDARLFTNAQIQAVQNINGTTALFQIYRDYWATVSGHSLELKQHFTAQKMVGGDYVYHRFQGADNYQPLWLCEAGSVFYLEAAPNKQNAAQAFITRCQTLGLPQPDSNTDWQTNPWIRENGFGEIVVNRPDIDPEVPVWIDLSSETDTPSEASRGAA